jgi:hypothetical protein
MTKYIKIPEDRARNSFSAPASVLSFTNRRLLARVSAVLASTSPGSSVAFRFVEVTSRLETNHSVGPEPPAFPRGPKGRNPTLLLGRYQN